jgi:uncharacterized membrane protein HdeD (DUF308 family)
MDSQRRHKFAICAASAGGALLGALGFASWRVAAAIDRTVHIVANGQSAGWPTPAIAAVLLCAAGLALLAGAVLLAIAARRAALTLERASLVELRFP